MANTVTFILAWKCFLTHQIEISVDFTHVRYFLGKDKKTNSSTVAVCWSVMITWLPATPVLWHLQCWPQKVNNHKCCLTYIPKIGFSKKQKIYKTALRCFSVFSGAEFRPFPNGFQWNFYQFWKKNPYLKTSSPMGNDRSPESLHNVLRYHIITLWCSKAGNSELETVTKN